MYHGRHITTIIPALNEAPSIQRVVEGLRALHVCRYCERVPYPTLPAANTADGSEKCTGANCHKKDSGEWFIPLVDQIIVCDNGSTDNTAVLAAACGAIVTTEPFRGYGAACLSALAVPVTMDIIVFVDGDHSVVANELPELIDPLLHGADLVIGSRTLGHTQRGALSPPQRFGNMLASYLLRKLWSGRVTDLGPFRAVTRAVLNELQMSDRQFGWTVEMQVKALQQGKTIVEIPVTTLKRIGKSKISGTARGVAAAANGILGTIFKLYLAEVRRSPSTKLARGKNN